MAMDKPSVLTSKVSFDSKKDKDTQRLLKEIRNLQYSYDRAMTAKLEAEKNLYAIQRDLVKAKDEFEKL